MSKENISVYDEIGADLFRLVKTDSSAKVLEQAMEVIPEEDGYFDIDSIPVGIVLENKLFQVQKCPLVRDLLPDLH